MGTGDVVRLEMWSVGFEENDGFKAPETLRRILVGFCYGHPEKPDGTRIQTSAIVEANGRLITTRSRVYRLGRIDPKYRKFLRDTAYPFDPKHPIRIKTAPGGEEIAQ